MARAPLSSGFELGASEEAPGTLALGYRARCGEKFV